MSTSYKKRRKEKRRDRSRAALARRVRSGELPRLVLDKPAMPFGPNQDRRIARKQFLQAKHRFGWVVLGTRYMVEKGKRRVAVPMRVRAIRHMTDLFNQGAA